MRKKDTRPHDDSYVDNLRRMFSKREMYKATCVKCGNACEVPFKPIEGKPVYCRECYRKR
ncbi:MAG: hypothetical protein KAK00_07800 [Nanoarchaeota archaeon]|nr:hypothetical protein [Nanoarchaeota archaeon]